MVGTHWAWLGRAQDGVSSQWKMLPGREGRGARESVTPAKMSVAHSRVGLVSCPGSLHAQCAGIGHRGSAGPSRHSVHKLSDPGQLEGCRAFPLLFCSFVQKTLLQCKAPARHKHTPERQGKPGQAETSLILLLLLQGVPFSLFQGGGGRENSCPALWGWW